MVSWQLGCVICAVEMVSHHHGYVTFIEEIVSKQIDCAIFVMEMVS